MSESMPPSEPSYAPLIPPDPPDAGSALDESFVGAGAAESGFDFVRARQRDRAVGMTLAGGTALLARAAGLVTFSWALGLSLLALGYLTVAGFLVLYRRRARSGRVIAITPWWIACDVAFAGALVAITGGIHSFWATWFVACAGRAALMRGLKPAAVVAAGSAVVYFAVLAAMGQLSTPVAWLQAGVQMLVLFGATGILLVGTARLRESQATIRRLHDESRRRVVELERVRQDLESTSALLRDLTLTDSLTGARNRRFFREFQNAAGERRARFGVPERRAAAHPHAVGVLLVDIDQFKAVNDQYGHPVGDSVLKHAARAIRRCLRAEDTLVRWGGDEFLVLLSGADAGRTGEVAGRVVNAMRLNPYEVADDEWLSLTVSVGWSHVDWHQSTTEPLEAAVTAADAALHRAKEAGRNQTAAAVADLVSAAAAARGTVGAPEEALVC